MGSKKRALAILAGINALLGCTVFLILTPSGSQVFDLSVGIATLSLSIFAVVLLLNAVRAHEFEPAHPETVVPQEKEDQEPCSLIEIERFVDQYPPKIQALLLKALESTAQEGRAVTPSLLGHMARIVETAIENHESAGDPNRTSNSQLSFVRRMKERRNL